MPGKPSPNLGMLVSGIVIGNGVDQLAYWHAGLNGVEEADELLMPMALHAAADHRAVQHVEGGKQRSGAMALVVMCHGAAAALLHGQTRLSAVECLDLALFVDRQHDGVGWRVDIEPDDLVQLGGELWIIGQLELARPMRLQAVPAPNALH